MKNNQKIGYLFLLPIFILVCIFLLYPFLKGFSLSFFETKYGFGEMRFAGLKNYKTIFQDEHFFIALRNSMIWVVGVIVLNTIVPLFIAILLNREFLGKGIAMGLLLIPWLTPVVGAAMLSKWLLEPEIGVINGILHTMEEREKIDQENQPSIGDSLKVVLSNKGIWLVSICIMMALGSTVTLSTFMPMALQTMYGIDLKVCGTIASMLTLGNCIGSITGPIVFSKIKNVKVFVSGAAVLSFTGIIMCWRFPSIFVLHILVLYTGIVLGASMPIFLSAPVLLEGLGTKYAGSAAGVISTLQLLGAVLIPTYILTPIAGDNYSLLFMLASICMVIMFLCGLLLPQFGNNQK